MRVFGCTFMAVMSGDLLEIFCPFHLLMNGECLITIFATLIVPKRDMGRQNQELQCRGICTQQ